MEGGNGIGTLVTQGGAVAVICVAFYLLLRWVLNQMSNIMKEHKNEREVWNKMNQDWRDTIDRINGKVNTLSEITTQSLTQNNEAHRHLREEHVQLSKEHKEIVGVLLNLNGKIMKTRRHKKK